MTMSSQGPEGRLRPGKIVCLARTFRKHAEELGNAVPKAPIYFLKPPSAVIGPGEAIRLPALSEDVQHEAELAVWIGQRLTRGDAAAAEAAIAGWTIVNDVTARDLQRADGGRFTRAKGFDTFCPVADARLPTLDWRSARIQCWVDGVCRQDGALADLLFTPAELLVAVSQCMTLMPGDLVSLGTPAGVGRIAAGQTVEVRLVDREGRAVLRLVNPVVAGAAPDYSA